MNSITTSCCIVGGGPAGIMLGYLLARAGIDVVVLEKHQDFLRDFRGDTVHSSTLRIMQELGLLDEFLKRPHQKINKVAVIMSGKEITIGDFSSCLLKPPYMVMMPQWDFLNFLVQEAKKLPTFKIIMQAEVVDLVYQDDKVVGAKATTEHGDSVIMSELLVGADGRHSTVRTCADLVTNNYGAAIDVLWFKLTRTMFEVNEAMAVISPGCMMFMINRGDYWQCAYVITKGTFLKLKENGLDNFREIIAKKNSLLKNKISEINSWDQVKLLEVQIDRLEKWYAKGVLCLGDAAHAMSPVGGVGINLAIQDAVAASKILTAPLRAKQLQQKHLAAVQARREFPTKLTQKLQIFLHRNLIVKAIHNDEQLAIPLMLRLAMKFPIISKVIGYIIGSGFRSERIIK